MSLIKTSFRIVALTVVGIVVIGGLTLWVLTTDRRTDVETRVARKSLRFYKHGMEWFADVDGHTQAQNRMVAGADTLLDAISDGGSEVNVTLSADLDDPGEWMIRLHLVEHDKFGATYRVTHAKDEGSSLAWLCNVTHDVFGGEHPQDIYVHSIDAKEKSWGQWNRVEGRKE